MNPSNFNTDEKNKDNLNEKEINIQNAFFEFIKELTKAEVRFEEPIDFIANILTEYFFGLHHYVVKEQNKKNSTGNEEVNLSKVFFSNAFVPILKQFSNWVILAAKKKIIDRIKFAEMTDEQKKNQKELAEKFEHLHVIDNPLNVTSLYNLFVTTILLIAKEVSNSKVSILFLAPDQVFLEAARMLKSADSQDTKNNPNFKTREEIRKIREEINYETWVKHVSKPLIDLCIGDKSEAGGLVSSEIPTYMLDWSKANKEEDSNQKRIYPDKTEKNTGNHSSSMYRKGSVTEANDESTKMGITAYIAVNYTREKLNNLNSQEIQNHPAHLGKWDAVLWQGERAKCKAILAVPISTSRLFIGILKVENPEEGKDDKHYTTDDGHYTPEAERNIKHLSEQIGSFFEEYKSNKQVLKHIWTAHVLSRISQRTTQLLELLERGEPLRDNFTKVIGYILTSLKLIYGASEGVHILTGRDKTSSQHTEPLNCHVLDAFYPEYAQRIRGILNTEGCRDCKICHCFIHSKIIDYDQSINTALVADLLRKELRDKTLNIESEIPKVDFMKIKDLESWKSNVDPSTFGDKVTDVCFEFVPLLTYLKLYDSFDMLAKYNKTHEKTASYLRYPVCPICLQRNENPFERNNELTKLIIKHDKCQDNKNLCVLCQNRKQEREGNSELVAEQNAFHRRTLVFRLVANPYDFGIVALFFKEDKETVYREKMEIVGRSYKDAVTTAILNSVRILGKFLDSEYEDVKRFYIPNYRKPKVDIDVSILFADIRGFSRLTKIIRMQNEFDLLEKMVNEYYRIMGDIIAQDGRVHQFLGDGIMAIFGEYEKNDKKGKCIKVVSAVCCALAMIDAFKILSKEWLKSIGDAQINEELKPAMGIGINFGKVRFNYFGGQGHKEYSPIGDHVNFAQRLERLSARYADISKEEIAFGIPSYSHIPHGPEQFDSDGIEFQKLGDIVVSKTVYDYLFDYLTDDAKKRNPCRVVNVKSFSFDYPVYCPQKGDLDLPKIAKELNINTKHLSGV